MTEAQFQRRVTDLCDWLGLRWFHSGDSRRDSCAGFPDLVITGPGGLIFAELKTTTGRVSDDQRAWLDELGRHALADVWRPDDWTQVETMLRSISRSAA